jgi:hypothetical protein
MERPRHVGQVRDDATTANHRPRDVRAGWVAVLELALSGGFFPLTGALGSVSLTDPARWGLGTMASTIDLTVIQASVQMGPTGQRPDALWTHDAAHRIPRRARWRLTRLHGDAVSEKSLPSRAGRGGAAG